MKKPPNSISYESDYLLEVDGLSVTFPTRRGPLHAVRDVSFGVKPGSITAIAGESGSGKSVCAEAIMGLLARQAEVSGSIWFRRNDLALATEKAMTSIRGSQISMIFQDPMASLDPVWRIGKQIKEAIRVHDRVEARDWQESALALLERVGIPDPTSALRAYPHEMSGGMQQRVMIALAIAHKPSLIIADEATTALDVTIQAQIMQLLGDISREFGSAIVLISHDLGLLAQNADAAVIMYAGKVVESGPSSEVLTNPRHPYTTALLNSSPETHREDQRLLYSIPGEPPDPLQLPPGCSFAPRCQFAESVCSAKDPLLEAASEHGNHLSACHFRDRFDGLLQRLDTDD